MAHPTGARGRRPPHSGARSPERGSGRGGGPIRRPVKGPGLNIPIAAKFTFLIVILVVSAMAWQAMVAIDKSVDHLEAEINDNGIAHTLSLAKLIDPELIGNFDAAAQQKLESLLGKYKQSESIKAISILKPGGILASVGAAARRSVKTTPISYAKAESSGISISEFEDGRVPVRSYSKVIAGEAKVEVLISAVSISKSRDDLKSSLMKISIIACVGAAFAALLLATILTRPVRTLMRDLRQVSMGDLTHQSQVSSNDEFGNLARIFNRMTMNLQTAQSAKLAQKAMEHELSLATSIQAGLLPAELPQIPGLDLAAYYDSAKEVGGDYYDFLQVDNNRIGVVVADVSGKGVPGSLVMSMTRSMLHMAARENRSPKDTIIEVNNCLAPDMNPGMFVTLAYLVLDTRSREVRLVRAGHNAPLLYSSRHGQVIDLHPKGIAIGLDREGPLFSSQLEPQKFTLQAGDVLVLYTDGIVEGKDPQGRDFGDDRLHQLLLENRERPASEILETIMEELRSHQKNAEQSDDITLLVLKSC